MPKKYIGSKLKAPFDGPQTRTIKNPDKPEVVDWDKQDLKETLKVLSQVTNAEQLRKLLYAVEDQLQDARAIERLPDLVDEVIWTGSLQQEHTKCSNENCQCRNGGKGHGPYWYNYPVRRPKKYTTASRRKPCHS